MNRLKRVVLITALFSGVMHVDNAFGYGSDTTYKYIKEIIQKITGEQQCVFQKDDDRKLILPPHMREIIAQYGPEKYIRNNNEYNGEYNRSNYQGSVDNNFNRNNALVYHVINAFSYCEACRWSVDDFLNAIEYTNGKSNLFTDNGLFYADNVDALLVDACKNAFSKFIEGLGIPEENSLYSLLTHLKNDHETKLNKHEYSECKGELKIFNTLGSLRDEVDILVRNNDTLTTQLDPQYGKISPDTIDAFINSGFINPSEFFRIPENEFKSDWEEFVAKAFTDPVLDVAIENFHKLKTWVASLKQYSEEHTFKSVMDKMPEMCLTYNLEGIAATCNDITRMTFIMMFSGIAEKTRSEQAKCLREKYESLCQEDDEIIPVRALGPDGDNNPGRVVNNDAPVELRLEFNAISSGDESSYAVEEVSEDNFKEEGLC